MSNENPVRYVIDLDRLPNMFPTHRHEPALWENLGRVVATFGFLEEILGKAIFALTATRRYDETEVEQAYASWLQVLEHALTDTLGSLIDTYGKALRDHHDGTVDNIDELLSGLRGAAEMRNILCHGSWSPPTADGYSVPFFVDRKKRVSETPVDQSVLAQVQQHVAELACVVVNTVTQMGFQFPGSNGPGNAIWEDQPL